MSLSFTLLWAFTRSVTEALRLSGLTKKEMHVRLSFDYNLYNTELKRQVWNPGSGFVELSNAISVMSCRAFFFLKFFDLNLLVPSFVNLLILCLYSSNQQSFVTQIFNILT